MAVNPVPDANKPPAPPMSGTPLSEVIADALLPDFDEVPSRPSTRAKRRTSPHSLLFQASAVLECVRIATLYGDFHDIPYLVLSDACASAEDSIDRALELMGDGNANLPDDDSDLRDDGDTDFANDSSAPLDDDADLPNDGSDPPDEAGLHSV